MIKPLFLLFVLGATLSSVCLADDACPRTVVAAPSSSDSSLRGSEQWYGSDSFAARLPADGVWPTTVPGHLIAAKLFWRSAGFRPGMESKLDVRMKPLNGSGDMAVALRSTNAYSETLGGWTMLTGIDFPVAGCWEITGTYLGQELRFVVETVASASR